MFNKSVCVYGLIKNDPMVTVNHKYYKIIIFGYYDDKDDLLMLFRQKFMYNF